MQCWQIKETLQDAFLSDALQGDVPYVAVLTPEEWQETAPQLSMGIDLTLDVEADRISQAQVNYDSLTGNLCRLPLNGGPIRGFAFALDEQGVVFIDRGEGAAALVAGLQAVRKWRTPSLARFLYDFLEALIHGHLPALTAMDGRIARLEQAVEADMGHSRHPADIGDVMGQLNDLRGELLDLRTHYEQLIDVGQELEENENGFFSPEELRFFRMFTHRVMRLQELNAALRDYAAQVKDLYQTSLEVKRNRVMNTLTVVTAIFAPLTLITGWYGMNFLHMPELASPWAYPAVMVLCLVVVVGLLICFKWKKWL